MKTEFKRRYFDVSNRRSDTSKKGLTFVSPFITARQFFKSKDTEDPQLNWAVVLFWLEYKPDGFPNESDFNHQPEISTLQSPGTFDQLPSILLSPNLLTVSAYAERIKDGDVALIKIGKGCLWTMIPRDFEGTPGPEIKPKCQPKRPKHC